jgi:hypothetical protein
MISATNDFKLCVVNFPVDAVRMKLRLYLW